MERPGRFCHEVDDRVFVYEAKPRVSVRGGPLFVQSELQDNLNELAWIAFTADLAPQFAYFFMPGGAVLWATFSGTRWTSYLDEQVRDKSAGDRVPTTVTNWTRWESVRRTSISSFSIRSTLLDTGPSSPRRSMSKQPSITVRPSSQWRGKHFPRTWLCFTSTWRR